MAEKEENPPEGDLPDSEGADKKILGLAKPLFMKVTIGVIVVIILAGAGAFFFMGSEEETPLATEEIIEEGELEQAASTEPLPEGDEKLMEDETTQTETGEKIMVLREEVLTLKNENLQLREQIFALQSELTTLRNASNSGEQSSNRKPDTAFLNSYGDDANTFPPIQTEPPKPKPKPRWGEFKRPTP